MKYRLAGALDRLADRIERADGLDAVADKLAAAGAVLKPGRVKDLLSGTPVGHPAHPILVTVPIGAWLTAGYLDVTAGRKGHVAARHAVGLGLLSALPATLTGYSDWLETGGAERRVGLVHAGINDVGIAVYGASWLARRADRHTLGVTLSVVGSTLLGVGGWLGGHLAYALGVGVDTTAFQGGPTEWTDVGDPTTMAEETPIGVEAAGVPLLVVRRGGIFHVLADRCTHRGAPLHEGPIKAGCIVCPWHDSEFDLTDGSIRQGPATRPQPVYEVRVHDDRLQVRRSAEPRSLRANPVGV